MSEMLNSALGPESRVCICASVCLLAFSVHKPCVLRRESLTSLPRRVPFVSPPRGADRGVVLRRCELCSLCSPSSLPLRSSQRTATTDLSSRADPPFRVLGLTARLL